MEPPPLVCPICEAANHSLTHPVSQLLKHGVLSTHKTLILVNPSPSNHNYPECLSLLNTTNSCLLDLSFEGIYRRLCWSLVCVWLRASGLYRGEMQYSEEAIKKNLVDIIRTRSDPEHRSR